MQTLNTSKWVKSALHIIEISNAVTVISNVETNVGGDGSFQLAVFDSIISADLCNTQILTPLCRLYPLGSV